MAIVLFRTVEIYERRSLRFLGDRAHVHLDTAFDEGGGARVAKCENLCFTAGIFVTSVSARGLSREMMSRSMSPRFAGGGWIRPRWCALPA
jgi:hypothetical protein